MSMHVSRSISLFAGASAIAAIVICLPATAKTSQEIAQLAIPLTVQINADTSLLKGGSGVLISRQGNTYTVLTANHVVKRPDLTYTVRTSLNKDYPARVQSLQPDANSPDLALVTFEASESYATAKLGDSNQSVIGSEVFVVGFPATAGLAGTARELEFTQGIVTSRPQNRRQGYNLRYNAITQRGMSGGPVFDVDGRVIGIHGQGDTEGSFQSAETGDAIAVKTGLNSAIPINTFLTVKSQTTQIAQDQSPSQAKPIQVNSPQTAKDFYAQGLLRQDQGDRSGAAESFSKAVQLNPNNAAAIYQRGVSLYQRGQNQAAISDFTQVIQIDPKYADAYYQRAVVQYELSNKQGALEDFTAALNLAPGDVYAHQNRGIIRRSMGDGQGTLEDFDQVVKLAPSARAYYNRALAKAMVRDKQGTIDDFGEAIRLDPTLTAAYTNRALVRRRQGDREGAIQDLTQALQLEPDNSIAYYNRALFRRDSGDRQGAVEDLQKAIGLFQQKGDTGSHQKATEVLERLQRDGNVTNSVASPSEPSNQSGF